MYALLGQDDVFTVTWTPWRSSSNFHERWRCHLERTHLRVKAIKGKGRFWVFQESVPQIFHPKFHKFPMLLHGQAVMMLPQK